MDGERLKYWAARVIKSPILVHLVKIRPQDDSFVLVFDKLASYKSAAYKYRFLLYLFLVLDMNGVIARLRVGQPGGHPLHILYDFLTDFYWLIF